jgi:hypothetical protein
MPLLFICIIFGQPLAPYHERQADGLSRSTRRASYRKGCRLRYSFLELVRSSPPLRRNSSCRILRQSSLKNICHAGHSSGKSTSCSLTLAKSEPSGCLREGRHSRRCGERLPAQISCVFSCPTSKLTHSRHPPTQAS